MNYTVVFRFDLLTRPQNARMSKLALARVSMEYVYVDKFRDGLKKKIDHWRCICNESMTEIYDVQSKKSQKNPRSQYSD